MWNYSFIVLLATAVFARDPLVVNTAQGKLRGFRSTSRSGKPFLSFTSIPFAKPPVGPLRFQPPQEPEPWSGIRNATDLGPWCIQYNMYQIRPSVFGVEDCLYLAVYTHDTKGSAPVMLHFHGGGFISGNGPHKTDPRYLMDEEVVVVDMNYRLGIMGFLSTEDEVMPGNQGLKDQVMALRWIKKNIAAFGGDPNKVTLVGESAGACSVYHHTVSSLSRGLFHGGIAESGTSYTLRGVMPPGLAKERAMKLASLVSCPQNNSKDIVSCLMQKNATEIVGRMEDFRVWQIDPMILFLPVLEPAEVKGAFLTGPISSWQHNPVPLLMGTTSGEGLLRTGYFLWYNMDFKWYNDNFERLAPVSLQYFGSASNPNEVTRRIRQYYFGDHQISLAQWVNLTNAYSDGWFTAGIFDGANKHTGDVYFYYFDYRGEYSFFPDNENTTGLAFGASHTDEILYIWHNKNFASDLKGKDLELSKKLVKIWTDFAKYGKVIDPSGGKWDKWTANKHRYMHITNDRFKMGEGLHEDRYRFWSSLNYRDKYL